MDDAELYLAKADECLAGAESELANRRFNNCANRCYYAAFQSAIAALLRHGITPRGGLGEWGHAFVQAEFIGQLVNRRKAYSADLRNTLRDNLILRERADYQSAAVSGTQAERAVRRTRQFLEDIRARR